MPNAPAQPAAIVLSTSGGSEPVQMSIAGRTRYRKDAIRVGTWHARHPATGEPVQLNVTPERLDRWVSNFARMQANGVGVDLTVDHKRGAESRRGSVVSLYRDGDKLFFDSEPADQDAEALLKRCPEVSIEVDPDVRDGAGNVYDEAITAISLCRKPVVTGQQPFERIAASRDDLRTGDAAPMWCFANPPDDTTNPPGSHAMKLTDEQAKTIREKLGLPADAKDEQATEKLMLSLDAAAKVPDLEAKVAEGEKKRGDLASELATAKEKSEPLKLSRDVQGVLEEAVDTKIGTLVERGSLTPAAAEKLKGALKSGALMLSREANGGETSRAMQVLEALAENKAEELLKLAGERSGPQAIVLSRETPGGEGQPKPEEIKAAADAAWGHVPAPK